MRLISAKTATSAAPAWQPDLTRPQSCDGPADLLGIMTSPQLAVTSLDSVLDSIMPPRQLSLALSP